MTEEVTDAMCDEQAVFPMHLYLHMACELTALAAKEASAQSYGGHNPHFMSRDAAEDMIDFGGQVRRLLSRYERHARTALAETCSPTPITGDAQ